MAVPDPTPDIRSPGRWLPAGHELPELYAYQRGGIWQVTPRVDRKGEQLPPSLARVTFGPLAINAILDSSEGEQWFDLLWYDGEQVVTRRVDGAALRSGRVLVRELGCFGIPFVDADHKLVERYLAAYQFTNRKVLRESRIRIAKHLGWQDDGEFVTADGAPRPVELAHPEIRSALAAHKPSGSLSGWQEAVARIKPYPIPQIVLAAAFAAPLLALLGVASFTIDVSGRSTRGKSTAGQVAASVWFDPDIENQGVGTWRSGVYMIELRLNMVRGLPVMLDDTRTVKKPEDVDTILYQVPMNQGTARGGGWASQLPWHTIVISTGEQPALSFTTHEGAAARVLSLRRAPFGLAGARSAEDASTVTEIIKAHHGIAGPAFVAKLREQLAEPDGAATLRKRHRELADTHAEAAANDIARRRAPLAAAVHLGAVLAHEYGIVPLEPLPIETWADLLADEQAREDRGELALDVVRALIAAQDHRIVPVNGARDTPAAGWIGARTDKYGGAVALLPGDLAQALNRANPPIALDAVKEAWVERKSIVMEGKRLARERVGTGPQVRCYVFPNDVLDGVEHEPETGTADKASDSRVSAGLNTPTQGTSQVNSPLHRDPG